MIKISHEIPKTLFEVHDLINDYPYVLAHLLMKGTEYYDKDYDEFYVNKLKEAEYSILDNSCYELGYPIDSFVLHSIGEKYKPSHIVIPDVYQDMKGTIESTFNYINQYKSKSTPKFLAVIQGTNINEYKQCFDVFYNEPSIDIIGINFKTLSDGCDRFVFLNFIHSCNKKGKKIHLLGCSDVDEFMKYSNDLKTMIHSVDTSAPITHGWTMNSFNNTKNQFEKPSGKIADNLDIVLNENQLKTIYHNVKTFRSFIH